MKIRKGSGLNDSEDSAESALKYVYKLLSYRDRSEKEVREKLLRKGFTGKVVEDTLTYFKENRFIDDRKFAEALKKDAAENKFLSRIGTRDYMINKGIPADIADELLNPDDAYMDTAQRLVEKKLRHMKGLDEQTIKKRLWGLLSRRGFSYDIAYKILRSFDLREEQDEIQ